MTHSLLGRLTRRERQIMDILFRMGRATADDVMSQLSGNPTSSTVRTTQDFGNKARQVTRPMLSLDRISPAS